jgi:glycosyltransferase involved in cell wall biosynthesis
MKIAMIFHSLNVAGGSASAFLSLALSLQRIGNKVDIYCYYFDAKKCFPELNSKLKIMYIKNTEKLVPKTDNTSLLIRFSLAIEYYLNAKKIFPIMKSKKYDVILASEACAYIPALIYKKKYKTPIFWSVFDPISLVDEYRPGLLINRYKWFKYILKIHNFFDKRKIRNIDNIIVSTKKMKKRLDQFYVIKTIIMPLAGVRSEENKKDYTGLIQSRLKDKFNLNKNKILLLSIGHFLPHRRYEDIILAVKSLLKRGITVNMIISGSKSFDEQYYLKIKNLILKNELENTIFIDTDFKTNDEIIGYYQFCDIFLFVRIGQNWGIAPLEAMYNKKPVIVTRGVEVSEVMLNKKNALIINDRSPQEILRAIIMLEANKELASIIAINGYELVKQNLTYDRIAHKLITFFKLTLNEK